MLSAKQRHTPIKQGTDMKFLLTMNMGSSNNNLVHLITCEHPAESLEEFTVFISDNDFVIVDEFYINGDTGAEYSRGPLSLNTSHIGKVKIYVKYAKQPTDMNFKTTYVKRSAWKDN